MRERIQKKIDKREKLNSLWCGPITNTVFEFIDDLQQLQQEGATVESTLIYEAGYKQGLEDAKKEEKGESDVVEKIKYPDLESKDLKEGCIILKEKIYEIIDVVNKHLTRE